MSKIKTPIKPRVANVTNNLATKSPAIAAEWSPRNGSLTPDQVVNGSAQVAWWRCPTCQHEWQDPVRDRTLDNKLCPVCTEARRKENSLATKFPQLALQWDYNQNGGLRPEDVSFSCDTRMAWKCAEGPEHNWYEAPNSRTAKGRNSSGVGGCPFCTNVRLSVTNSLATMRPDLAPQFDVEKNGGLTAHDVLNTSTQRVWWTFEGESWQAKVRDRTLQKGSVPHVTGHRLGKSRSIAAMAPHLVSEWAQELNGDRTPENTAARSGQLFKWRRPDQPGLVWKATPADRLRGRGDPFRHGHRVCEANSLATLHPTIAESWHPDNSRTAAEVTAQSSYPALWTCALHDPPLVWRASVKNRVHGTGCPHCNEIGLSRAQHRVAWELRVCFPDIAAGRPRVAVERLPVPGRQRTRKYREVDIVIPGLRVLIEYDGLWFHRSPEKVADDQRKTAELQAQGYTVLRLRERGLPLLSPDDIEIEANAGNKTPHVVAGLVVRWLLAKRFDVPEGEAYLAAGRPLRAVEAERDWADLHSKRAKQRRKKAKV